MSPFPPNTQISLWYDWARCLGAADPADFLARVAPLTPAHWAEFWPFAVAHGLAPWFYTHFAALESVKQSGSPTVQQPDRPTVQPSDCPTARLPAAPCSLPSAIHSPLPTVHCSLFTDLPLLPPDTFALLKKCYLFNAVANIRSFQELAEILDHTNAASLPVIVLKGAHIAAAGVYPDHAERVMADTDLLVHPSDLPTMQRIMTALGYSADDAAKRHHHITYRHAEKKMVEVHHKLWLDIQLQGLDNFWQNAKPFQLEGRQALVLAPADAFLHLALHAASYHRLWRGLRSLLDMLLLTRTNLYPDFWTKVRQTANEIGYAGSLPRLLYLTEHLLNTTLPGERNGLAAIPLAPQLLRDGCRRALATSSISRPDSLNFTSFVRTTSATERWAMLRSRLFPTPRAVAQACGIPNTPRVWLHYPGYIFARVSRLLLLLIAAMLPKWRNARLAEGDPEREFIAAFESLTVPEAGGQRSEVRVP